MAPRWVPKLYVTELLWCWRPTISRSPVIILTLSTLAFALTSVAAWATAPRSEWILEQWHDESGRTQVYVSRDAVKIVNVGAGYVVLATAPDWQVCCYRPTEKIQWLGGMEFFNGIVMRNPFAVPSINERPIKALNTVQYRGIKCTRYCPPQEIRPVIYGADEIPVSDKGAELLCRYFYVHKIAKVPVYRLINAHPKSTSTVKTTWLDTKFMEDLRRGDRVVLKTESVRAVAYNAADFQYPKNFKRIREIGAVSFSNEGRDNLGSMMDEIGFTSERGSKALTQPSRSNHNVP